jgi:glycosyltransferase involved in cell wall biosynthesis
MNSTDPPPSPSPADDPTFSVVIPTFARPELLAAAVASVLAQTRPDWECLVVDDGGASDFTPPDPRVRVVHRERTGGPAAARNTGLDAATGSVVVFLDDDDRFSPDRLDLAAQGLERADVAVCWTRWSDDPVGVAGGRQLEGDVSDHILDATTPHLGATAVRTDRLVRFDETFSAVEDVEWWLRMAAVAAVATVPRVGCELGRHGGTRANDTDVAARIRCSGLLLDVHAPYFRSHPSARAFRLARMGVLALSAGDRRQARASYLRSIRARPSGLAVRGLARSWAPTL